MNIIGGQEITMTALQNPELWEKTDRWDDGKVDIWFKTKLKNDTELGLGFTHEEPLTNIMKNYINSYRDLPCSVYQFQTKFRNEIRAKSGVMRTREFVMKDLYSFCKDEAEHNKFYEKAKEAYKNIFKESRHRTFNLFNFCFRRIFLKIFSRIPDNYFYWGRYYLY